MKYLRNVRNESEKFEDIMENYSKIGKEIQKKSYEC